MLLKQSVLRFSLVATLLASAASAATFGRVVPIGGHAADIALDEARGLLYVANFTASRIDVMSLTDYTVGRSFTVASYPASIALSPDGRYLVVAHYGASASGQDVMPAGRDALTVLDLSSNQRRTFGLSSSPVGVAFDINGLALILTHDEFLLFDPQSGMSTVLGTLSTVLGNATLPVAPGTGPLQITGASMTATPDGRHIYGIANVTKDDPKSAVFIRFSYAHGQITAAQYVSSSPQMGPRSIAVSRDGSYYMAGWGLFGCGVGFLADCTAGGPLIAQWPNTSGNLNVGSLAIRSSKSLIYAQITPEPASASSDTQTVCLPNGTCVTVTSPSTSTPTTSSKLPPSLLVLDADNLNVRDRIQLPENLAGKSAFNSDESILYSISDSGILVLPMAQLDKAPRVMSSSEDVVFRGNFCASGPITQQVDIVDPAGNATPFTICVAGSSSGCSVQGITISPSSGMTPARVKITIDPSLLGTITGTNAYPFEILSASAVNMPAPPSRGRTESYTANVRSRFRVLVNNRVPENRGAFFNLPGELVDLLADPSRNRFYVLRLDKNQVQVYDSGSYTLIATLRTSNTPTQMAMTFDRKYLIVGHDNSQLAYMYDLTTLQPARPIMFPLGHYPRSIAASSKAILAAARVVDPNTPAQIDRIDLVNLTASPLASLGPYRNGGKDKSDITEDTVLMAAPNGSTIVAATPTGALLLYDANADSFTISRKDFDSLKGSLAASSYGSYVVDHFLLNESLVPVGTVLQDGDSSSGFAFVNNDGFTTAVRSGGNGYIQRFRTDGGSVQTLPTGMVEAPRVGAAFSPFSRTLATLADQSAIVALTASGFTVLPWNYDAARANPVLDKVVNSGDFTKPVAPGSLISIMGSQLSPMTLAATDAPLPTVLADSCLTVNGLVIPIQFVSPTQINAQLPFQIDGNVALVLHTPGGVSDTLRISMLPTAPSIFRSGTAGPLTGLATVVRESNQDFVTPANPIHPDDRLVIYLTGMGRTSPEVPAGDAAPSDPLAQAQVQPNVSLGGVPLAVDFAGLTPGLVGVYQINARVPFKGLPTGFEIPLTITQGGGSTTVPVRVVN
jgi:uncharacterized protein (TIGR03437 family)